MKELVIGSRGSDLALWQANFIKDVLQEKLGIASSIRVIVTTGDRITNVSFDQIEGVGFFTKEIEEAILRGEVDIAVHSLKDLTTTLPAGLTVPAFGFREDRRELLLARKGALTGSGALPLKDGAVIGTSSARRRSQIRYLNPTLKIKDIRGNVPTRIDCVKRDEYDAIVIALAGVKRLNSDLTGLESIELDPEVFLPAAGQGTLALESRDADEELNYALSSLTDEKTAIEIALERGLLKKFNSGCSLPLGVHCEVNLGNEHRLVSVLGVEGEGGASELRKSEVVGRNVEAVIAESYDVLVDKKVGRIEAQS